MRYTPQERSDAKVKSRLWLAYADLVDGEISQEAFDRIERQAWRVLPSDEAARRQPQRLAGCPPQDPTCVRPKMLLRVPHRGQRNGFYCGPASGTMIAAYKGKKRSAVTHKKLSQNHMASRKHMKTRKHGKTAWESKLWARGLNRWLRGKKRGPYTQVKHPSKRKIKGALLYNTRRTKSIGISTLEFAGGAHYNGHPTGQTIGHWVVSRGYGKTGKRTFALDPASTVWPESTHKRFRAKTKRLARIIKPHGIAG